MQMVILPAHCSLDQFVKIAQRAIRHLDTPPNRRCDFEERDFELEQQIRFAGGTRFLGCRFWIVRYWFELVAGFFEVIEGSPRRSSIWIT